MWKYTSTQNNEIQTKNPLILVFFFFLFWYVLFILVYLEVYLGNFSGLSDFQILLLFTRILAVLFGFLSLIGSKVFTRLAHGLLLVGPLKFLGLKYSKIESWYLVGFEPWLKALVFIGLEPSLEILVLIISSYTKLIMG